VGDDTKADMGATYNALTSLKSQWVANWRNKRGMNVGELGDGGERKGRGHDRGGEEEELAGPCVVLPPHREPTAGPGVGVGGDNATGVMLGPMNLNFFEWAGVYKWGQTKMLDSNRG